MLDDEWAMGDELMGGWMDDGMGGETAQPKWRVRKVQSTEGWFLLVV
jgi:hypothetical protein